MPASGSRRIRSLSCCAAADYKHMPQAASAALKLMKHLSGEETNDQAQQHCKRRAGRNELQDGVEL
jgi:hypothetical protein